MLARGVRIGLMVFLCGMAASPVFAQSNAEQTLAEADRLFQRDQLAEAEPLYKKLLGTRSPEIVRTAYDQLLAIYTQLSRWDVVIRTATEYRQWLIARDPKRGGELDLEIGRAYYFLGHLKTAEEFLLKARDAAGDSGFDPLKRFAVLAALAQVAQKKGQPEQAKTYWKQMSKDAGEYLARPPAELKSSDKIRLAWKLADAYLALGEASRAIDQLEKLLPLHDGLSDLRNKRETYRRLADASEAAKRFSFAARHLEESLKIHERIEPTDRLTPGEIAKQLARLATLRGDAAEAERQREIATRELQFVIRNPGSGQKEVAGSVAAFWELEELYRGAKQFKQALRVSEEQAAQWVDGSLLLPRINLQQGGLQTLLGSYKDARDKLVAALHGQENQKPLNLLELPKLYNNLGLVELQLDGSTRAEEYARKSVNLYSAYRLPEDLTLVEAHNILGNSLAQQGSYNEGIDSFEQGEKICARLGEGGKLQRSYLLLNIAILLKSQGKGEAALKTFLQAREVYTSLPQPDELILGAFDASLACIYTGLSRGGDLTEAGRLGQRLQELCHRRGIDRGPLVTAWRHSLALEALAHARKAVGRGDATAATVAYDRAFQLWDELRQLQEKEKQALLLPRTLNYLGICCEMQGRDKEASTYFIEARRRQQNNPRAFPQTNFITHWRTARLLDREQRPTEALQELERGIRVVEETRLRTVGAGEERAAFFQQFENAFELYVDWSVRDGRLDDAFLAVCRGRSRSLFDQLQLSQVDPTRGLEVSHKAELELEKSLLKKLSGLRAQAQLVPAEAIESERARKLLEEFDAVQEQYALNHRAILNASPVYRALSDDVVARTSLETIRKQILDDQTVLLVYYIGRDKSHALLLTNKAETSSAHPLQINSSIAESITRPEVLALVEGNLPHTRGMKVRAAPGYEDGTPPRREVTVGPLNQTVAKHVVDHYWGHVTTPTFRPNRGMKVRTESGKSLPSQRFDLLGDVFLPQELRDRIAQLKPRRMVVIPDGPLHKLPLESMLIDAGEKPIYVIDVLPPIVYAPSAAILAILGGEQRPSIDPKSPATLLTLANPNYERRARSSPDTPQFRDERTAALFGRLPLLEGSKRESQRIRSFFEEPLVRSLDSDESTEGEFRKALKQRRFVHVAAHGFADDRFSNAFGALLLTPPAPDVRDVSPEDDGMLELNEIYTLPLKDTELAVLSACLTNAGPQQPLEAGVTLASGFLAAGVRNVVASNWSVDDDATAILMDAFFAEIRVAIRKGEKPDYPAALQSARKKVRADPRYASPYYWAPFVIIGQVK